VADVRLFEYAVLLQPKEDKDGEVIDKGRIIVEPVTVLAEDQEQATLLAGRAIPEEFMDRLDRLTVAVRPF
jgi:hypothetical protein